jgi:ABC-type sugar transport system permease subunit/ABC-type glycerol-3-phosphate transport system substrate-binding protein
MSLMSSKPNGLFLALLCSLFVAGSLAGLASAQPAAPEPDKVVKFTSGILPNPITQDASAKAERAVVRAFLKTHPNYQIKPFTMPTIQGSAMDTGVLMGIAAGNPPHAIYVNFRQSATYINHGFLEPLEILLARVKSDNPRCRQTDENDNWLADPTEEEIARWRDAILARVPKPAWKVIYRDADVQKQGIPEGKHIWALPYRILIRALFYRKDVFKRAGLDPERAPEDWNELTEYCRKIRTLPDTYGLLIHAGDVISWGAFSFMVSKDVEYMQKNADGQWAAAFNTMGAAEAIYYILQLAKEPFTIDDKQYVGCAFLPLTKPEIGMKWDNGQIGMQFSYLSRDLLSQINPELMGIAPVPKAPDGTPSAELNAAMAGVFRQTTPAQKLAVMEYLWFITGDEAQRIRTDIYVKNGLGQFVNPDLLEKFGYDDILRKVPPGWRKTFMTALAHGVPEPYGKNTQFIYTKVSEPINWALRHPELLEYPREEALSRIKAQLEAQADRVDKYVLGQLPEEEWRTRRTVGLVMIIVIAAVFIFAIWHVLRAFTKADRAIRKQSSWWKFRKAYLLMAPAFLVVLFWQYVPLVMGAPLALFDYELVIESSWVGIDNFATIFFDEQFWASLGRTFYWVLLTVGLGFWPPIMVAILLDEVPTGTLKYFFRTVFYLPTVVSGVIMIFLWRQLYEGSDNGAFNQLLAAFNSLGPVGATIVKLLALAVWLGLIATLVAIIFWLTELTIWVRLAVGLFVLGLIAVTLWPLYSAFVGPGQMVIEAKGLDPAAVTGWSGVKNTLASLFGQFQFKPIDWLNKPSLAMLCCVLPRVWAMAGPGCIIYLAAMKTVPEELIEAASIDGAGILQKMCYITLPRVKFLVMIQLVGFIVGSFRGGVNYILAMTGGGPGNATTILSMDIFERTFMELHYGIGAAMAWMLGALVILLTAYQLRRLSRAEFTRTQV